MIDRAARLNPYQPTYHRMVPFLHYFATGHYSKALKESLMLKIPTNIWDPVLRLMVRSRLFEPEQVQEAREKLYKLEPEFKTKQDQILRGMLFNEALVEMVKETLDAEGV